MTLELVPLCEIDIVLADPLFVGEGPGGMRLIYEVLEATVTGERVNGSLKGRSSADWITVAGTVGTLDVRATFETDDGAVLYTYYGGRTDLAAGPGGAPIYVAPRFETGDPRYAWLNAIQAVGKGTLDGNGLHYDWYELR